MGLTLLLQLQACIGPAVDSQLLRHHNKQRPHKGQPAEQRRAELSRAAVWDAGWLAGRQGCAPPPTPPLCNPKKKLRRSISPLSLRKQSCLYWARCEERLTAFFSLPPFPFSLHLYFHPLASFSTITHPPPSPSLSSSSLPPVFHPRSLSLSHLLLWNKSTAVSASL